MKPIVFRGEGYHRTQAERGPDEPSLGEAVRTFFDALTLPEEDKLHLKETYRDAVRTAIQNERKAGDNYKLTTEQKIDVINRSLFVLSRTASLMERIRDIKSDVLIPELLNKKEAERALEADMSWVREEPTEGKKRAVAVVQIDLDDFKEVNDKFGHESGDQVLRGFGEGLHAMIRKSDQGIHFSGDEFGILMRFEVDETPVAHQLEDTITSVLARIVENGAMYVHRPDDETQALSVGFTTFDKDTDKPPEELLEEADRAVSISKVMGLEYELKNGGRPLPSHDRIFSFSQIDQFRSRITPEEKFIIKSMRCLKRTIREFAADMNSSELDLTRRVYETLKRTATEFTGPPQTNR